MRFIIAFITMLVSIGISYAEEGLYSILKSEILTQTSEKVSPELIRTDYGGDTVSVIAIKSPIGDLTFEGSIFLEPGELFDKKRDGNEYTYIVNMTNQARHLKVLSNNYHYVDVIFPQKGGMNPGEYLEVRITGVEIQEPPTTELDFTENRIPVSVETEYFVDLYIDGKEVDKSSIEDLEEGNHYFISKYEDNEKKFKVKVKDYNQIIDVRLGGEITIKNARNLSITSIDYSPTPNEVEHKGGKYKFNEMVGTYRLQGIANSLFFDEIKKVIKVSPRSSHTYRLDEMIPHVFYMYHGTDKQPFGANLAYCKDFGLFISYSSDAKTKIKTSYGESEILSSETDSIGQRKKTAKYTSMTVSAGPMFRVWRKLYAQIGAGWAHYLSTSEPNVLTADYKYKSALSTNAEFIFRIKTFVIGLGYMHQFTKNAFDPSINDQATFSIGVGL